MQQVTLCGRCADVMRNRFVVKLTHRNVYQKVDCDVCKRHTYGAEYDIERKSRKDERA
jgi:hypothetical protein